MFVEALRRESDASAPANQSVSDSHAADASAYLPALPTALKSMSRGRATPGRGAITISNAKMRPTAEELNAVERRR